MENSDYPYPVLVELANLVNGLDEDNYQNEKSKIKVREFLQEAQMIIRLGETAHGNRHREILAPNLILKVSNFIENTKHLG